MKILGIVVEYNPFHNGHKYHLEKSKTITQCDASVAVMSGNFVQKGEIAIYDKYTRAALAVEGGVDLVLEIPTLYATGSSEYFAFGSIDLLNKLNVVDSLCFGSECNDITLLNNIAQILVDEPDDYKDILKSNLASGISFPKARDNALSININFKNVLSDSNNILGIEYLKALKRLNSNIKPYTIQRESNNYNDSEVNEHSSIASATSIRNLIKSNTDYSNYVPYNINNSGDITPLFNEDMYKIIRWEIEKGDTSCLKNILDVSEGLENKIKKAIINSTNFEELVRNIKSKRYTQTRIQRILIHICLNITDTLAKKYTSIGNQYIKVLAFNDKGKKLISEISKKSTLPIIMSTSKSIQNLNIDALNLLNIDILASNLYSIIKSTPTASDYTHKIK